MKKTYDLFAVIVLLSVLLSVSLADAVATQSGRSSYSRHGLWRAPAGPLTQGLKTTALPNKK